MRLLYTLLAILTVSVASAQSRIVVSHGISHGDNTYTHVKGNNNNAETCFTATGSSTIVGNVNGLVIETIVIDNTPYTWTGVGAEVVADAFSRWDDLNEIYRNRGSQRPILDRTTDLLNCDGWNSDSDGWRINSIYPGYAYYLNTVNGRFEARLTTGYGTATNSQYYQYLPGFGTGVDGSGNTDPNGLGIYFNNGNGFETIEALEEEIILAIGRHMNPQPEEEEEEVEDPATDQWIQGGIQGFLGYGTARYNQQWSNPIYPGYAYNTVDHQYTPNGVFIVRIGVLNSGVWEHVDIPGSHNGEAAADNAARAYIESRASTDSYTTTAAGSYRITRRGDAAWYVEIRTPSGTLSIFRAFTNEDDAEAFAADPGSYVSMDSFELSDFESTYSNAGWLAGIHDGGNTNWTITAPDHLRNTIEATWIWTDSQGAGHTGERFFTVPSTTRYYHGSTGVYYDSLEDARIVLPNARDSHFTVNHTYGPGVIDIAQREARDWAIDAINDFILNGPTEFNRNQE